MAGVPVRGFIWHYSAQLPTRRARLWLASALRVCSPACSQQPPGAATTAHLQVLWLIVYPRRGVPVQEEPTLQMPGHALAVLASASGQGPCPWLRCKRCDYNNKCTETSAIRLAASCKQRTWRHQQQQIACGNVNLKCTLVFPRASTTNQPTACQVNPSTEARL